MTPSDLLRLRDREQDAFKTYQVALRKAALEPTAPKHIEALFEDVVAPEIRRMNATLKDARRSLIRSVTSHIAGASASVAIAAVSGLVSPGAATLIAALGGAHFTKEIVSKLSELYRQEPKNARENSFYFLWKASRIRA